MKPEALDREIERVEKEGGVPLLVCATAGTTVRGSFDNFDEIADICKKHNVWFHIDVCPLYALD